MKYERIAPIQPGYQWMTLEAIAAWASRVPSRQGRLGLPTADPRPHLAVRGHDEEILSCNIAEAWTNLKLDFEAST